MTSLSSFLMPSAFSGATVMELMAFVPLLNSAEDDHFLKIGFDRPVRRSTPRGVALSLHKRSYA
jgi:hypothetical protein